MDEHDGSPVKEEGSKGGASVQVSEDHRVSFTCAVKSRPPAYNITWMHNVSEFYCTTLDASQEIFSDFP